ncbi:GNAT family N-acetyltransferase [Sulfitobacter sp. LCG007]
MEFRITALTEDLLEQTTLLWESGWHDAHDEITPPALMKRRTSESFARRLRDGMAMCRIAQGDGRVLGFHMIKQDELYQFYVSAPGRGRGVAQALIADAEQCLREAGHATAWLACAIGNRRAASFYEKCGWTNVGVDVVNLDTQEGIYPLRVWRFEKPLA